jgi:hypothetical protein
VKEALAGATREGVSFESSGAGLFTVMGNGIEFHDPPVPLESDTETIAVPVADTKAAGTSAVTVLLSTTTVFNG